MTELTLEGLAELEKRAKAALAADAPWEPDVCDYEEGGRGAHPRIHQCQDAEMLRDYDMEEEAAGVDHAYLEAVSPAATLGLLAMARELIRLRGALLFLKGGRSPGVYIERAVEMGWADPFPPATPVAELKGGEG